MGAFHPFDVIKEIREAEVMDQIAPVILTCSWVRCVDDCAFLPTVSASLYPQPGLHLCTNSALTASSVKLQLQGI